MFGVDLWALVRGDSENFASAALDGRGVICGVPGNLALLVSGGGVEICPMSFEGILSGGGAGVDVLAACESIIAVAPPFNDVALPKPIDTESL